MYEFIRAWISVETALIICSYLCLWMKCGVMSRDVSTYSKVFETNINSVSSLTNTKNECLEQSFYGTGMIDQNLSKTLIGRGVFQVGWKVLWDTRKRCQIKKLEPPSCFSQHTLHTAHLISRHRRIEQNLPTKDSLLKTHAVSLFALI